jgi:hypothetical protein
VGGRTPVVVVGVEVALDAAGWGAGHMDTLIYKTFFLPSRTRSGRTPFIRIREVLGLNLYRDTGSSD